MSFAEMWNCSDAIAKAGVVAWIVLIASFFVTEIWDEVKHRNMH